MNPPASPVAAIWPALLICRSCVPDEPGTSSCRHAGPALAPNDTSNDAAHAARPTCDDMTPPGFESDLQFYTTQRSRSTALAPGLGAGVGILVGLQQAL